MSVGDGCFSVEHVNGLDTNEYDAPSIPIIEVVNAPPLSVRIIVTTTDSVQYIRVQHHMKTPVGSRTHMYVVA